MEIKGLITLAEKLAKNEISSTDPKMVEASKLIAKMSQTEEGRQELAEIVKIALEDSYNKFNIIPLLFDTKHFNLGDKPMFKTHKKGIKAYWTAPNSYVPKSQNYETEIFMQFEGLGVRPECLISDLKTGRVDSYAALIADGKEAMELAIYHKVYELLAQTYNATGVASQHQVTNALTKSVLDEAINKVRKKVGGAPTIIADYDLCTSIESFDGFSELDSVQEELRNHGLLGKYRGCNIVYLPEILDPTTQESIVPTDKMFIVGRKIGVYGDYADMDFMQEVNINDKSWNCRIDKELGMAITKPEGIFVINIAA
jgi:hypothetical protein